VIAAKEMKSTENKKALKASEVALKAVAEAAAKEAIAKKEVNAAKNAKQLIKNPAKFALKQQEGAMEEKKKMDE